MNDVRHEHFQCSGCMAVFCTKQPPFVEMTAGDNCPQCHIATVVALPTPTGDDGEFSLADVPMPKEFKKIFEGLGGVADRDEKMLVFRERQVKALERIADCLEGMTKIVGHDDQGRAAVRVVGEIVGGDGDVTADVR